MSAIFIIAIISGFSNNATAGFIIDDFSDNQDFYATGTAPLVGIDVVGLPGVTMNRTLFLTGGEANIPPTPPPTPNTNIYQVSGGQLAFYQFQLGMPPIPTTVFSVLYDNFSTPEVNVTNGGTEQGFGLLGLSYGSSASPPLGITITVETNVSAASVLVDLPAEDEPVFVPFDSFVPDFDFEHVTSIRLDFTVPASQFRSVSVNTFVTTVVPEPASIGLFTVGAIALMGMGLRRRKSQRV